MLPDLNPAVTAPPSRPPWEHDSTARLKLPSSVLEEFDDASAGGEETAALFRQRTILMLWPDGLDKIAKTTRAPKEEIWRIYCRALDLKFDLPLPEGSASPPAVCERHQELDPSVFADFDAAADKLEKIGEFGHRNRNILLLRLAGVSAEGVCRAIPGCTPAIVWEVVRRARRASITGKKGVANTDGFRALVERQRAGRRGRRAQIVTLLRQGTDPEAVRKRMRVHGSTVWRAMQQTLRSA